MKSPGGNDLIIMTDYEIIKPDPEDWQDVLNLRLTALNESPQAFGQTPEDALATGENEWRRRLSAGQYTCAKKIGTRELIGMVCAVQEKNHKCKHIAHIYSMYILPRARSQGIGRTLMLGIIEDVLRTMPEVIKLELRVSTNQVEARNLYLSLGFQDVGLLEKELFVDGVYIDEFEMHKFIREI
jgi:ribosomal protein S18 acetylase RimI-like enzyme